MIKIVAVGKIKDNRLSSLIEDYLGKISHYHKIAVVEVKDEATDDDGRDILKIEGQRILDKIKDEEYVIVMDLHGKQIDSVSFAQKMDSLLIHYPKITFVIGGSTGLDDSVRHRANMSISFSQMTFTHQMSRLLLVEQIYRCFKILHNETYHK